VSSPAVSTVNGAKNSALVLMAALPAHKELLAPQATFPLSPDIAAMGGNPDWPWRQGESGPLIGSGARRQPTSGPCAPTSWFSSLRFAAFSVSALSSPGFGVAKIPMPAGLPDRLLGPSRSCQGGLEKHSGSVGGH